MSLLEWGQRCLSKMFSLVVVARAHPLPFHAAATGGEFSVVLTVVESLGCETVLPVGLIWTVDIGGKARRGFPHPGTHAPCGRVCSEISLPSLL
jgi:hypothetical protein